MFLLLTKIKLKLLKHILKIVIEMKYLYINIIYY